MPPSRAVVRTLAFPLSFLLCGLGFLGILVGREHRALHDVIAGSADHLRLGRPAARLRFLARQAELTAEGLPPVPDTAVPDVTEITPPPPEVVTP